MADRHSSEMAAVSRLSVGHFNRRTHDFVPRVRDRDRETRNPNSNPRVAAAASVMTRFIPVNCAILGLAAVPGQLACRLRIDREARGADRSSTSRSRARPSAAETGAMSRHGGRDAASLTKQIFRAVGRDLC